MDIQNIPDAGCAGAANPSRGGNSQQTAAREGMVGLAHFQIALSEVWKASLPGPQFPIWLSRQAKEGYFQESLESQGPGHAS